MSEKNYINPSMLSLVSQYVKQQNIELLETYGKNKKMSAKEIEKLKNDFIKLNHTYPNVVQKKNREFLQTLLIK
jgi:hypothetical protein